MARINEVSLNHYLTHEEHRYNVWSFSDEEDIADDIIHYCAEMGNNVPKKSELMKALADIDFKLLNLICSTYDHIGHEDCV